LSETATERAFNLARSGTCASIADIERKLKDELYEHYHMEGRSLRSSLRALIQASRTAGPDAPKR